VFIVIEHPSDELMAFDHLDGLAHAELLDVERPVFC